MWDLVGNPEDEFCRITVDIYLTYCRPAESDLNRFGLNWAAVWVKMASSWMCVLIYLWTLIIPSCWMGRDLTFTRASQKKRKMEAEREGEGENLNDAEGGEVIDSIESAV